MELRPHLTFAPPKSISELDPLSGRPPRLNTPSGTDQFRLFKPKIQQLQTRFAEHIALCESVDGLSPEKVLVLELAGSVKDFANALSKVQGFEYMTHWLTEDYADETQVYLGSEDAKKPVECEIYLTMSNQEGLKQLLSHWQKATGSDAMDRGLTPLCHALKQLNNVRFWDTEDRIKKTGILEDWQYRIEDIETYGSEAIPFEIELWFRPTEPARNHAEQCLKTLIEAHGGKITSTFVHTGIAYHALRGELPIEQVKVVIEKGAEHLQLMRCDDVMFFRPLGQCGFSLPDDADQHIAEEAAPDAEPLASMSPVVALFDGLPLENHSAIAGRIIIEDPDDYSDLYHTPREQLHGTAMASLIIHGDKNAGERRLDSPLYMLPILAPANPSLDGKRLECIPEGVLPLDLIHRAVKRLFEGDGDSPPAAPDVKAINLSVCDPRQLFDRNMSPWARMLDWLSHRYNVLFVVSAGNHLDDINLETNHEDFQALDPSEKEKAIVEALDKVRWSRRLMSPAESVNALTVKAAHHDHSEDNSTPNIIDPFSTSGMFSPINPISLGKANSIKPEIMASGGRVTYRNTSYHDKDPMTLSVVNTPKPFGPGHKVAVPGNNPGDINGYAFSYGTSNATALTTRRIAMLHETINSMKEFQEDDALAHAPEALILKALVTHGAELSNDAQAVCENALKTAENSRTYKGNESQLFGYGQINEQRIHACTTNQATLIHTGKVKLDDADIYRFPLPNCLSAVEEERRMIITLAWFSPINPMHSEYRQAQLWVSDPKQSSPLEFSSGDYYHHHQKKGTVYHDVIQGDRASPFLSGDEIQLKVNCKARAGGKRLTIPYALVVTLDSSNVKLPIYEEVKASLEQQLEQVTKEEISI